MTTKHHQPVSTTLVDISNPTSKAFALRLQLDAIQLQMAALESQMALLRVEREEILQDLRDIVYPILTLPTDVTSEIFLQYVKKSQYPDHTERNNGPVRLASICRAWRAIALSTCRIWTLLDSVDAKISAHALANCLKFRLPRVGSLPVDLRMKLPTSPTPESDGIIRVLDQHSRRWGTLKISSNARISFPADVRGPFSALTKIAFHTQNTTPAWATITGLLDAPRLREVELDAVDIRDWQESLPWHLLTTLDLWFSDVAQCLGILPHTPNLEHLLYLSESEESPHPSTSISVLPHLKSILTVGECSGEILDYLTLPALETLHLIPECAAALGPLMARSRSSPQILELNIYEPKYTLIHKCISSLPTIRELRVTCESLTDDVLSDLFKALANNPSLIPALASLDIAECPISVDLLQLERMLSARTTDAGVSKLKSVRIRFIQEVLYGGGGPTCRDREVELALDRLRKLRSQGLSLEFPASFKWFSSDINSQMVRTALLFLVDPFQAYQQIKEIGTAEGS